MTSRKQVGAVLADIEYGFRRPGVWLGFSAVNEIGGVLCEGYDSVSDTGIYDGSDLSILESLGLVRYVALKVDVLVGLRKRPFEVIIYYHHLTHLGVEFCEVCSKPRVDELNAINDATRKKGLKAYDDGYTRT